MSGRARRSPISFGTCGAPSGLVGVHRKCRKPAGNSGRFTGNGTETQRNTNFLGEKRSKERKFLGCCEATCFLPSKISESLRGLSNLLAGRSRREEKRIWRKR